MTAIIETEVSILQGWLESKCSLPSVPWRFPCPPVGMCMGSMGAGPGRDVMGGAGVASNTVLMVGVVRSS